MDLQQAAGQRLGEVRQVLRGLIAERGYSLREVDRRLGRSGGYTNQALRGKFQLTVLHVFQILAAVEVEPEEFYRRMLSKSSKALVLDPELNREMLLSIRRAGDLAAQLQALQQGGEAGAREEATKKEGTGS